MKKIYRAAVPRGPVRMLWPMLALLVSCGGGGGTGGEPPPPPPPALQLALPGQALVKLRSADARWVALAEVSRSPEIPTRPDRQLHVSLADGRGTGYRYEPPAGWSLLDFALQPSGEISVLLGSDRELRLARLTAAGLPAREQAFTDPQAATDPFYGNPLSARDHHSLLPHITRDAARLAPLGEDVALALRSGRHAVVLHRLGYTAAGGFATQWRSLVEPGVDIGARFLTGGSFDPFKSLDHHWRVLLDSDAQGRIAVAVSLEYTDLVEGHAAHFGERLGRDYPNGALLSQFSASGQRLGTVLVNTQQRSELQALRWVGDRIAAAGRVRTRQTEDGWDAWLALLPAGATTLAAYRVLDFDACDVILDIAQRADGRLLVAGSTGFTQNPAGASVSEQAQPLLALLSADGQLPQRLALTPGPRHNQLRALASRGGDLRWLTGGMQNGPGTHSADGDAALLNADGYVRELRF